MVNIGEIIKQKLKERRKTVVWLAREMSCSRTNIYKIFEKSSIDTAELLRISSILEYDFFAVYSEQLGGEKGKRHHHHDTHSL